MSRAKAKEPSTPPEGAAEFPEIEAKDEQTAALVANVAAFINAALTTHAELSLVDPVAARPETKGELDAASRQLWNSLSVLVEYTEIANQKVYAHTERFGSHMIQ